MVVDRIVKHQKSCKLSIRRALFYCFDIGRFGEERVGYWFVVFDGVIGDAAGLNFVAVVIDDEGRHDAVDCDQFVQAIFFGG